jgi:hypothetical protein
MDEWRGGSLGPGWPVEGLLCPHGRGSENLGCSLRATHGGFFLDLLDEGGHPLAGFSTSRWSSISVVACASGLPLYTRNPDDFRAIGDLVEVIAV